ncbi:MAG: hypothetical protein RR620_08920 [Clostridium sp.]
MFPVMLISCGDKELSEKKLLEELKGKVISIDYTDEYLRNNKYSMSVKIEEATEIEITERHTASKMGTDQVEGILTMVNSDCIIRFPVSIFLQKYDAGWKVNRVYAGVEDNDRLEFIGIKDDSSEGIVKFLEDHIIGYKDLYRMVNSASFEENKMLIKGPFTYKSAFDDDYKDYTNLEIEILFDDDEENLFFLERLQK